MELARLREVGGCSLSNNCDLRLSIRLERWEAETGEFISLFHFYFSLLGERWKDVISKRFLFEVSYYFN
jgi:hypothetical protein